MAADRCGKNVVYLRSVEADVAVVADAQQLQVNAAHSVDDLVVLCAGGNILSVVYFCIFIIDLQGKETLSIVGL